MDPKLQYFLDATGWSKEDLIRKLSSGENTDSTETDCVTSTTSFKTTPQRNINKPTLTRQINPHYKTKSQSGINKTTTHTDKNKQIDESVVLNTFSSSVSDDLLSNLNTKSSYLPPLCYVQSSEQSKVDQSAVIDLVSDAESLDPIENNSDRQGRDKSCIDICSDSEDSYKEAKKSNKCFNKSNKSSESRKDPTKWKTQTGRSRNKDPSPKLSHSEHSVKDTSRYSDRYCRHRSSSSNRQSDDRQYRKTQRKSRSRSRSRYSRSRSQSRSRRCSRSRRRNRNERFSSGSRSNRSRSKSVEYKPSRKRTRSTSRDCDKTKRCKKTHKSRTRKRPVYSAEDLQRLSVHSSYYGKEITPPKYLDNDFDFDDESQVVLKDTYKKNGTSFKKRKLLTDPLINLSENKNSDLEDISTKQIKLRNKSFESVKPAKIFSENHASDVSQLKSNTSDSQSNNNSLLRKHKINDAVIINKDSSNSSKVKVTNVTNKNVQYPVDSERNGFKNQLTNQIISEDATLTMLNAEKKRLVKALMRETEENIQQKTITNIIADTVDIMQCNIVPANIKLEPVYPKSTSEISCNKTTIENLSDISDCTSNQLDDNAESDKKDCATFLNADVDPPNLVRLENVQKYKQVGFDRTTKILKSNIFDIGSLSDISDCTGDTTDDMDVPIVVSTDSDLKDRLIKSHVVIKDDLTVDQVATHNTEIECSTLKIFNSLSDYQKDKNVEICVVGENDIDSTVQESAIEDADVKSRDTENLLEKLVKSQSTAENVSALIKYLNELINKQKAIESQPIIVEDVKVPVECLLIEDKSICTESAIENVAEINSLVPPISEDIAKESDCLLITQNLESTTKHIANSVEHFSITEDFAQSDNIDNSLMEIADKLIISLDSQNSTIFDDPSDQLDDCAESKFDAQICEEILCFDVEAKADQITSENSHFDNTVIKDVVLELIENKNINSLRGSTNEVIEVDNANAKLSKDDDDEKTISDQEIELSKISKDVDEQNLLGTLKNTSENIEMKLTKVSEDNDQHNSSVSLSNPKETTSLGLSKISKDVDKQNLLGTLKTNSKNLEMKLTKASEDNDQHNSSVTLSDAKESTRLELSKISKDVDEQNLLGTLKTNSKNMEMKLTKVSEDNDQHNSSVTLSNPKETTRLGLSKISKDVDKQNLLGTLKTNSKNLEMKLTKASEDNDQHNSSVTLSDAKESTRLELSKISKDVDEQNLLGTLKTNSKNMEMKLTKVSEDNDQHNSSVTLSNPKETTSLGLSKISKDVDKQNLLGTLKTNSKNLEMKLTKASEDNDQHNSSVTLSDAKESTRLELSKISKDVDQQNLLGTLKTTSENIEMKLTKVSEDNDQHNSCVSLNNLKESTRLELSKISKDVDEQNLLGTLKNTSKNLEMKLTKASEDNDQHNSSVSLSDIIRLELTKESSKNCRGIDPESYSNSLPIEIQDSVTHETELTLAKLPNVNIEEANLKSIIEAAKSTGAEHISEITDDTPSLDIDAILKKCKDDQERALKQQEGVEDKASASILRVRPRNRRPNFTSLRDNSISTIRINKLLEKLSYNDMRAVQKDDDGTDLASKDSNFKERPLKVEEKLQSSEKETNIPQKDLDTTVYEKSGNDNIRTEILKQLDILRNQRNDATFTTSINPTTIPKGVRKKTLAKQCDQITDDKDDEDIHFINDDLKSPIIWLTKTSDYKQIKGWKNKSMGFKLKKCPPQVTNKVVEDFAVPSCSFHYPSVVDDIIENVVADNLDEVQAESEITEDSEKNAFSSSILDEFLLDKSEMELKISYEVPMLLMGPKIDSSPKVDENFLRGDVQNKVEPFIKYDTYTKEGIKPRTLAEKRKLFQQDYKSMKIVQSVLKQSTLKPFETYRNLNRNVIKRSVNDDLPNTGHNKRKDFAVGSVYWKGKKFIVPCREKRTIYFRTKIVSRYSQLISNRSKQEVVPVLNPIDTSPVRDEEPPKAMLWSPDKMIHKPTYSTAKNISYKAGPMCKKPELTFGTTHYWKCIIKPLPKIFLEITAEFGKSIHPRALQFLYAESEVNLSNDKVEFALAALKDSKPTKYRLPVSYENGQTQFTLRQKHIIDTTGPKSPPICGDVSEEIQEIVDDLLTCLEIQSIQDTVIKDDPDFDTEEHSKQNKKDTKESPVTTKVTGINKQLRLALGRLQVKFIDINIDEDEDPNKICDKKYCQLGCVCASLSGVLPSKEHCRRIECVFGCICGYKPPINTTVTLPHGSDLDLISTVDKLQSEVTKNLAKVEKEFTQTIVCTKNETFVLGDTLDRRRRCTRAPKKFAETAKNNEDQKYGKEESNSEQIRSIYGIDVTECSVRIEKVDMYHIIPFCWRHELYQCQCLKEFLIARSQEKANNLALQLENDNEDTCGIQNHHGLTLSKLAMRRKIKKIKKKISQIKRQELKMKIDAANKVKAAAKVMQNTLESPEVNSTESNCSAPNLVQENLQSKSSRRKQVLSTMVDISEKATVQVRKLKEPVLPKKPIYGKLKEDSEPDFLRFLVPTSNVRLQFLKMLKKPPDAKDEFRLLSFVLLSDRFNRRLFHVWYTRTDTASKYLLTMDSMRPSPEYKNVRFFDADFKTDNYLIQWLMEGSIPMTAVQDFLVILRLISIKKFEICGMCEKSKIEYTDEPLPLSTPTQTQISSPPKMPIASSVPYNVIGASQQDRKILNIQNQKIPTITCSYPSVALTGKNGLFHASLPSINAKYKWFMLLLNSTFAVLNMTPTNYCIPHEYLVEMVEQAKITNSTTILKNKEIRGRATHVDFAVYVAPQHKKYIFIGPYQINEELTCETLCYYKNMLVSTDNFNKIHGNPEITVGSWIKQVQMKIHFTQNTTVASPNLMQVVPANTVKVSSLKAIKLVNTTKSSSPVIVVKANKVKNLLSTKTYLKPILPKPATPSPPQLLKISDFMAAKKGRYAVHLGKDMPNNSPRTSLLIVNNNILSSSVTTGANKITLGSLGTIKSKYEVVTPNTTQIISPKANTSVGTSSATSDDPLFINHNINEDIRVLGLDYRDAEFIDKSHKTLQFLVSNIPGFGYIRIYRCQKTNYIYLMWRFVKIYKSLMEAKKSLIHLIESTVIIVPANFKITITLLNAKPNNIKLINSDYYFDTYIAGRFGVHLLSNLNMSMMIDYLKINETDAAYIKEKSSGMLLKKCYNIASTFLTKDDLTKIRNWNDMMSSLKGTIDFEQRTAVKLTDMLQEETSKNLALQAKLDSLKQDCDDSADIINITPVKATSEVIEISDDDNENDSLQPKLATDARVPTVVTGRPIVSQVGEIIQSSNTILTNTQQRTVGFVSMAQNFKGTFKLMPHNQNSVLITRIKTQTAATKTTTNDL